MAIDSQQDPVAPAEPALQTPPYLAALPAPVHAPAHEAPLIAAPKKSRPAWIVPAAIAVAGLIASGSLGYLFYSTSQKLQATQAQLTQTQLTLDSTSKELRAEKAQAAYVQMYENDTGRESTDFATLVACDTYSVCRSAANDMLSDTQSFQSDRQTARVPSDLASVDSMLGDALTAEIASLKDLQSAITGGNADKIQAGFAGVNDATLSLFKTESALGKLIA